MKYNGKNILITGGTEGIGRAAALLFTEKGANVFVFSRSKEKVSATVKACREIAGADQICEGFALDVTDFAKVKTRYKALGNKLGNFDVLINAAGFSHPDYFEKIPMDKQHSMMEVNYFGVINSVQAALPFMQEKGGSIVNVSSLCGFLPVFGYSGYTGSKFAVLGMSDVLRSEFKRFGISVSVLCPPDTETPGFEKENKTKPPETVEISKGAKLLSPEQVAKVLEKGIRKRKKIIIPGSGGKLAYWMQRFFPGILSMIFNSSVRKVQKKNK